MSIKVVSALARNTGLLIVAVISMLTVSLCFSYCGAKSIDEDKEITSVNFVDLLDNPKKYNKKMIKLQGFLHVEFEDHSLYRNEKEFKDDKYRKGIWVGGWKLKNLLPYSEKYVSITGKFDSENKGHMGMFQGSIDVDIITSK